MDTSCPECDTSVETVEEEFEHRVREHTDAGDGDSFDLYDEEVFDIFTELAVRQAVAACDNDASVRDVIDYMNDELGVPARMPDDSSSSIIDEYLEHDAEEFESEI